MIVYKKIGVHTIIRIPAWPPGALRLSPAVRGLVGLRWRAYLVPEGVLPPRAAPRSWKTLRWSVFNATSSPLNRFQKEVPRQRWSSGARFRPSAGRAFTSCAPVTPGLEIPAAKNAPLERFLTQLRAPFNKAKQKASSVAGGFFVWWVVRGSNPGHPD